MKSRFFLAGVFCLLASGCGGEPPDVPVDSSLQVIPVGDAAADAAVVEDAAAVADARADASVADASEVAPVDAEPLTDSAASDTVDVLATPDVTATDAMAPDAVDGAAAPDVAALPDATATPDVTDVPAARDVADATAAPDVTAAPDAAVVRDVPDVLDARDAAVALDAPDVRDAAVALDAPDVRDAPVIPDVRDVPDALDVADVRDAAVVMDVLDVPDVRDVPDAPDARDVLDAADVRDAPDVQDVPDVRDVADVLDVADVTDVPVALDLPPPPDVAVDLPAADVTVPNDPVSYTGTLPIRTDGRVFRTTFRIAGNLRDVWVRMPRVLPPRAPLMLAFHGTNSDGQVVLDESGAGAVADANGVVFIAPTSRWFGGEGADFDHPGGNGTYWETSRNPNPDTNEDVLLVRAIIQEARRVYGVDPTRVYAYGHSNGGFMAYFVTQLLRDRVVGFGANAAGLSRCDPQQRCRFQGAGATCAALSTQSGWCSCAGPELPVPLAATGRRTPAVLFHGTADPLVSVYHTCTMESALRARGYPVQVTLFNGGGHANFDQLAPRVWGYLSAYRLGM